MTRPDPPNPKPRKRTAGVSRVPSSDPSQALEQLKRSMGAWHEKPENPAIKLIACESNVGARINSYANGRWVQRRVTEDTLVAVVELQDGSQEKLKFHRGVLDSGWKRAPA